MEMMSEMDMLARWKRMMKSAGTTWNTTVPRPPKFRFNDNGWPAEIMQKSGHQMVSKQVPIDPWGQRHRS